MGYPWFVMKDKLDGDTLSLKTTMLSEPCLEPLIKFQNLKQIIIL
jgi:hypothetical protein